MSEKTLQEEMQQSGIRGAICAVMAEVKRLEKASRNEFNKYNFTSVDDFKDAIRPIMARNGLYVHMTQTAFEMHEYTDESKKTKSVARFDYDITLKHDSGQDEPCEKISVALPYTGAQTSGAARSYALKEWIKTKFMASAGDMDAEADALAADEGGMRLSKADARDTYKALASELQAASAGRDSTGITKWWNENDYRIKALPQDWFLSLRAESIKLYKELKAAEDLDAMSNDELDALAMNADEDEPVNVLAAG